MERHVSVAFRRTLAAVEETIVRCCCKLAHHRSPSSVAPTSFIRCMELGHTRSYSARNSMVVREGGRRQMQGRPGVHIWPLDRYLGGSVIAQAGARGS
ncbi:hypothetical protein GOP47_0026292 [Adiantum capillus-veneris]|nr:hypothetical protein GOP47_0026292 [Adiantum capillus-veneris]